MKTESIRTRGAESSGSISVHDQKREHILAVAEDLFYRNGYAGTTIADIVRELGVTKPFLYYYFSSKSDIFETLCWRASHACLTAMHFKPDDERAAIDKLREGLHRFAAANVSYFKSGTFAYREGGALDPAFMKKLRTMARRFYKELCALLEQARNDGELDFDDAKLTALSIGSIAGFMYTWYKPGGRIGPEDMVKELTRILMKIAGAYSQPASAASKIGRGRNAGRAIRNPSI
ncbi:TetR/AcrR family transcriptional regulator [Noviherbaspirillum saxi]|uniref:TetR/AcrR family transcriptional regulator n=1 Tax=Noviherbaspirillum saxi TaxID=2320863 RepID=A0A3A3FLZ3_9BURK|nr:TetR/AcrR family transcriptional regulator [Noviherbaspirillum saxi]RJF96204.1 TetR/AcrR family transcriptional regulator [Noviherbaspirillum saxi]